MAPQGADPLAGVRHLRPDDPGSLPGDGVLGAGQQHLPVGGFGMDQGGVAGGGCVGGAVRGVGTRRARGGVPPPLTPHAR